MKRILSKKQLKDLIPYSSQHIARLEKAGKFPQRIKLGPNRVGWLEDEVKAWIQERIDNR
ncbi:transcriptional regulator [Zhengella mangrovi]|uniref:Transcriptional regulator n=2 Tax=Zhengella mangrovi TaxID=1982044 RepID=A0A2G1QIY2_9HYPH|nr:transcriptional regulator [Zhengella mangrovi]